MIAEYKLYQGAVLAELVHRLSKQVSIDELSEAGRLSSYRLDGDIGLHVKHSSNRLPPWQFTFTRQNVEELGGLQSACRAGAVVLVCRTDGFVCLPWPELRDLIGPQPPEGAWLRVSRRRREWYGVSGSAGGRLKVPNGIEPLLQILDQAPAP